MRDIKQEKIIENTDTYTVYELYIPRDNLKIYTQIYIPNNNDNKYATVLASHGFGSNHNLTRVDALRLVTDNKAAVIFDFCGGSNECLSSLTMQQMSVMTQVDDLQAILQYVKEYDFVDKDNIFLLGRSQGGLVSSLVASKHKDDINAVVLFYPAYCIIDDANKRYANLDDVPESITIMDKAIGKKYYTDIAGIDVYEAINGYDKNVLIIHGDKDNIVPIEYSYKALQVLPHAKLITINGAGHGYNGNDYEVAIKNSIAFINDNIKK